MSRGRRGDEWDRWAKWMQLFAEANRNDKKRPEPFTQNVFLPPEFKTQTAKAAADKMTLKQLAEASGHGVGK